MAILMVANEIQSFSHEIKPKTDHKNLYVGKAAKEARCRG